MSNETKIRIADSSDCSSLLPLAKEMATSFTVNENDFETSFTEILSSESAICLVAEKNKEIVGYLIGFDHRTFYANGRVSWVEEIFVKEQNRREGIGEALMEHFEQWSTSRESKLIGLATRRASEFYRFLGYEESATFFRKLTKPEIE